jgi:hypothetical protein
VLPQPPPEAVRAISMSPSPPRRFIKRSRRIGQAKDDLRCALIISIVGMGRSGCAAKVSDALTSRFDLKDDVLDLRRVAPNTFVALLPNVEMADRMFSGGQSFYVPPLRMHIKRWSRQFMASDGGTLPHRLDIERRGLPFHLWGLHTAEQLLVGHCLVHELHLDSIGGSDLSAFKLSVWCHNPGDLPSLLDLHVKEPPVQMGDEPSPSRTVVYPVSILVSRPGSSPEVLPPPHFSPPSPDSRNEESDQDSKSQQKHRFNSQSSSDCAPVHTCLGSRVHLSSAASRPVNDPVLPADAVNALVAPANPSVSSLMAVDASFPTLVGPVDAPALPDASDVELAAPGYTSFPAVVGPAAAPTLLDASGAEPAAPGPILFSDDAADYPLEDCSTLLNCSLTESQRSASAPVHTRLGPHVHLSSAAGRPVNDPVLPADAVNVLVAPANFSVSTLMAMDASFPTLVGPVDAPALPDASVVELAAPGSTSFPAEVKPTAAPTLLDASCAESAAPGPVLFSDDGLASADYSLQDCSALMNCSLTES